MENNHNLFSKCIAWLLENCPQTIPTATADATKNRHVSMENDVFLRENAWDVWMRNGVGKFKGFRWIFRTWKAMTVLHLLVEGSLGWFFFLNDGEATTNTWWFTRRSRNRRKWFLTNKIFSRLRRTLVFEGDNFHRFSLNIFDIQKFCSISASK